MRLYPAHSGSTSFHLPHHPRNAGGAEPWPSLNFSAQRAAPILRKCASGWNGSVANLSNTTSKPTPRRFTACVNWQGETEGGRGWGKLEKGAKWAGGAPV